MKTAAVYGSLTVAAMVYGGWALVAKVALQDGADPMVFAFYRCLGGVIVLFAAMLIAPGLACSKETCSFEKLRNIPQSDLQRFGLLGACMAANICGFILGASKLSALTVSVFQPTIPVFAMVFSVIFGVEQITKHKFAGIAFMIAGAMCVVAFGESHVGGGVADQTSLTLGMLYIFVNVCGAGLYLTHNKDVLRTYEPVFATAMTYLCAAPLILAGALLKVGLNSHVWLLGGSTKACLGLAYAVVLTTALNYSILAWANKRSSPVITSSCTTLQPISAALLSVIFLGIGLSAGQMVGGACIIAGFVVMFRGQLQEDQQPDEKALLRDKEACQA